MRRHAVWIALANTLVMGLGLPACMTQRNTPVPGAAQAAPKLEVRRKYDQKTGKLVHEWTLLVARGTAPQKHGKDLTWYPSGAKEWERAYAHGKPSGTWRRFYESGGQQSETLFAGDSIATTMTFWREDGKISMQGPAKNGERCGTWRVFNRDGTLAEEGPFVNSMREGTWTIWTDDGKTSRVVQYKRNVRVGEKPSPAEAATPTADAERGEVAPKR
jgi:antitoxin component YwqK of YwqJK toxin-antitoxin module